MYKPYLLDQDTITRLRNGQVPLRDVYCPRGTCRKGHEMVLSNSYKRPNGSWECRTCRAAASRNYRARQKALRD